MLELLLCGRLALTHSQAAGLESCRQDAVRRTRRDRCTVQHSLHCSVNMRIRPRRFMVFIDTASVTPRSKIAGWSVACASRRDLVWRAIQARFPPYLQRPFSGAVSRQPSLPLFFAITQRTIHHLDQSGCGWYLTIFERQGEDFL